MKTLLSRLGLIILLFLCSSCTANRDNEEDAELFKVRIRSKLGRPLDLVYGDKSCSMDTEIDGVYIISENLEQI